MQHLNEYINEELQQINEFLLMALCGACALHFGVKGLKKVKKYSNNFWDWATGEKNINMSMQQAAESSESIEPITEAKKFDKSKVQPMQVPDDNVLENLFKVLKVNSKKKKGFYVFDQLFKDTPELKKMNKAPYYANYVVFMDPGSEDDKDAKPNFYGMLGFSVKYWQTVAKKGKDEKIKNAAQDFIKYIDIFAVQTDPKYAKKGLFDVYLDNMKKAAKEAKMNGLTIKYESDEIADVFAKYGFEKIKDLDGRMKLDLVENKEEGEEGEE